MAQTTTLILLPQTAWTTGTTAVVGTAQKAAGYYLGNSNLQTVTWDFTNVNCIMYIEASLASEPASDSDWFEVYRIDTGGLSTQRSFTNIEGNYTWIRCRANPFVQGVIQSVKVSY
jgi:hypothetical protein